MKKVFALLAIVGMMTMMSSNYVYAFQDDTTATEEMVEEVASEPVEEAAPAPAPVEEEVAEAIEEEAGFHQVIKNKFIDGGPAGIVHLRDTDKTGSKDYFINAKQIVSVEVHAQAPELKPIARLYILTTQIRANESVSYSILFPTREEANAIAAKIVTPARPLVSSRGLRSWPTFGLRI